MANRVTDTKLLNDGTGVYTKAAPGKGLEISLNVDANGAITSVTIINGGVDYLASTPLYIQHPKGTDGQLSVSAVDVNGTVTAISVDNAGSGYETIGLLYAPQTIVATLVEMDWFDPLENVPDPIYLTNAYTNIKWYQDALFTTYKEFMALGMLGKISSIEEGFDLQAYSVTLSLSGIPKEFRYELFNQVNFKSAFQNRPCKIYIAYLDNNYNIIGEPILAFAGQMDFCTVTIADTIEVKLTVESRLVNWERARGGRYNSEDQKVWYPLDTAFDLIPDLLDNELLWGERIPGGSRGFRGEGSWSTGSAGLNSDSAYIRDVFSYNQRIIDSFEDFEEYIEPLIPPDSQLA